MKNLTIAELAELIEKDWGEVDPKAKIYLSAMKQVGGIKEVCYFLCSAITWRGDLARMVKRELNRRLQETH